MLHARNIWTSGQLGHRNKEATMAGACCSESWWIAVYAPKAKDGRQRGVNDLFKITRVRRYRATSREMAIIQASRMDVRDGLSSVPWELVSIAQEVQAVY